MCKTAIGSFFCELCGIFAIICLFSPFWVRLDTGTSIASGLVLTCSKITPSSSWDCGFINYKVMAGNGLCLLYKQNITCFSGQ